MNIQVLLVLVDMPSMGGLGEQRLIRSWLKKSGKSDALRSDKIHVKSAIQYDVQQLIEPAGLSLPEAIEAARKVMVRQCPLLDLDLARMLPRQDSGSTMDEHTMVRILELLDAISQGPRVVTVLVHLVHHPSVRVRSKAAVLIGRRTKNIHWLSRFFQESDTRVRANLIEAVWGLEGDASRALLQEAKNDLNNRVVGNALYGQHLLGEPGVVEHCTNMAADPRPEFRATAAWVMGETAIAEFTNILQTMVKDEAPVVRRAALRALVSARQKRQTAAAEPGSRAAAPVAH